MDKLIEALQILLKYENPEDPTRCVNEILYVFVDAKLVSEEDKSRLRELSFFVTDFDCFASHRYGSA